MSCCFILWLLTVCDMRPWWQTKALFGYSDCLSLYAHKLRRFEIKADYTRTGQAPTKLTGLQWSRSVFHVTPAGLVYTVKRSRGGFWISGSLCVAISEVMYLRNLSVSRTEVLLCRWGQFALRRHGTERVLRLTPTSDTCPVCNFPQWRTLSRFPRYLFTSRLRPESSDGRFSCGAPEALWCCQTFEAAFCSASSVLSAHSWFIGAFLPKISAVLAGNEVDHSRFHCLNNQTSWTGDCTEKQGLVQ